MPNYVAGSVSMKIHQTCSCCQGTYVSLGEHTCIYYVIKLKVLIIEAQSEVNASQKTTMILFRVVERVGRNEKDEEERNRTFQEEA